MAVVERCGQSSSESVTESKQRMLAILEMAPDAFVELDPAGLIVEWNSQAERTFGWSREEAIGRPGVMVVPPRLREAWEESLRKLHEGPKEPGPVEPVAALVL